MAFSLSSADVLSTDTINTLGGPSGDDLSAAHQSAAHFLSIPSLAPKMPWEMMYPERRRASKDPRIMKQVAEEDQFEGTSCSGVWRRLREFALPKNDWLMGQDVFVEFLETNGARGAQFIQKVFHLFDTKHDGKINGLMVCKYIQIAITTSPTKELFARHCFERFDRPIGEDAILFSDLVKSNLMTAEEVAASTSKRGKKGKRGASPQRATSPSAGSKREAMVCGAKYNNVIGLRDIVIAAAPPSQQPAEKISFEEFLRYFSDPRNGEWIGSFMLCIFECCNKYFSPPQTLPLIPLRWLKSVEPLPSSSELYDADVVMLREIERTGVDPAAPKDKKKGKGSRSSSPKKKKK